MALPLRLFLGATFLYAGLQKLLDANFFRAAAPGSIARQLHGFVQTGSPLASIITAIAIPHPSMIGAAVALAEIWVGLSTLTGLMARLGAAGGLALSLTFYLTASWTVHPYFLGPDLPYAIAWLTLLLAGPGPYSADAWLFKRETDAWRRNRQHRRQQQRTSAAPSVAARMTRSSFTRGLAASAALAVSAGAAAEIARGQVSTLRPRTGTSVASLSGDGANPALTKPSTSTATSDPPAANGRSAGAPATNASNDAAPTSASLGDLAGNVNGGPQTDAASSPAKSSNSHAAAQPTSTPAPSSPAPANGVLLGNVSVVPVNQAGFYTDPASGDPALLVHLTNGRFVAFDAVCTHAGCTVQYDPSRQMLVCPCHGAMFDPSQNARVMAGPADMPLAALNVSILDNGDVYALPG